MRSRPRQSRARGLLRAAAVVIVLTILLVIAIIVISSLTAPAAKAPGQPTSVPTAPTHPASPGPVRGTPTPKTTGTPRPTAHPTAAPHPTQSATHTTKKDVALGAATGGQLIADEYLPSRPFTWRFPSPAIFEGGALRLVDSVTTQLHRSPPLFVG